MANPEGKKSLCNGSQIECGNQYWGRGIELCAESLFRIKRHMVRDGCLHCDNCVK